MKSISLTVPLKKRLSVYVYPITPHLFDVNTFEGCTWDNDGKIEDIATGSAAGQAFSLKQGHFLGRSSELGLYVEVQGLEIQRCLVSGTVFKVANICLV